MLKTYYTKKEIKKNLIQKQLNKLNKFIIYLPNINKKNVSRFNKSNFFKIHNEGFINKTIPANCLISDLNINYYKNQQLLKPILFFSNNLYLIPNQVFILNKIQNYKKILITGHFYIKLLLILKVFSVKKI